MRKLYNFLALALFVMGGAWMSASAQIYEKSDSRKTTFADGDTVAFYCFGYGGTANMHATADYKLSSADNLAKEDLFVLEVAGNSVLLEGKKNFYIKHLVSGQYLGEGPYCGSGTKLTTDKSKAMPFEFVTNGEGKNIASYNDWIEHKDAITYDYGADDAVSMVCYESEEKGWYYLAGYGGELTVWGYSDTGSWEVFGVTAKDDPLQELIALVESLPDPETVFGGTSPGQFDVELVEAYKATYLECNGATFDSHTGDEYKAYIAKLQAAYDAMLASEKPLVTGYYYIQSAFDGFFAQQKEHKVMKDDTSQLGWGPLAVEEEAEEDEYGQRPIVLHAKDVFYITMHEDGTFDMQGYATKRYVGQNNAQSGRIPMVTEVNKGQRIAPLGNGIFNIYCTTSNYAFHAESHGGGAGTWGKIVGWNGGLNSASAWCFRSVSEEQLEALQDEAQQIARNSQYRDLYDKALGKYNQAVHVTELVTDGSKYSCNKPETSEGSYAALVDNNTSTYFHSSWTNTGEDPHFLQAELCQEVTDFNFYTYRRNANARPTAMRIFATNDPEVAADMDVNNTEANWNLVATITDIDMNVNDFQSETYTMDSPAKYLRFVVDATSNNVIYFTYGEFHIYEGHASTRASQEQRLATVRSELLDALQTAYDLLGEDVTAEQLAALQAAYDAYMAEFVEIGPIDEAIATAKGMIQGVEVGEATGQVKDASKLSAVESAIAAGEGINLNVNTKAEADAILTALTDAIAAFRANVNSVESGKWYYILSAQRATDSNTRHNMGIHIETLSSEAADLYTDGLDGEGELGDDAKMDPTYLWRFVEMGDGKYAIQNMRYTTYIGGDKGQSAHVKTSVKPVAFNVDYIGYGQFQLKAEGAEYALHAAYHDGVKGVVVGWNGDANSGSAWKIVEVSADNEESLGLEYEQNTYEIVTLPFAFADLFATDGDVKAYKICGKVTEGTDVVGIKVKEITSNEAGVPFILMTGDPAAYDGSATTTVVYGVGDYRQLAINTEAGKANGLVGTFRDKWLPVGCGDMYSGKLYAAESNESNIAYPGYGYIDQGQITESEAEDAVILCTDGGKLLDKVADVLTQTPDAIVNVYSMDGKLVKAGVKAGEAAKGMTPGIYVIGKKKVAVK